MGVSIYSRPSAAAQAAVQLPKCGQRTVQILELPDDFSAFPISQSSILILKALVLHTQLPDTVKKAQTQR